VSPVRTPPSDERTDAGPRVGSSLALDALSWLRRIGLLAITVLLVEYLVLPRVLGARADLHLFLDASPVLLVLAVLLEVASLLAYTALTRLVLCPGTRPRFGEQLRIDLPGLGVSHVVPGGGATAAALRYRLMTDRGVPADDAASTAAVQSAVAAIGLVGTFLGGLLLMGPGLVARPGYLVAELAAAAALAAVAFGLHRIRVNAPARPGARPARRTRAVTRDAPWIAPLRRLGIRAGDAVSATARRTSALARDPQVRFAVFASAVTNWLFDAASLWVCLKCYGPGLAPGPLLAAYGAANLLALLPVTPGGLGIVEGVLVPALTGLGGAGVGPVTLGVLTWRLLEFWIPIPVAGLTYLSLRLLPRRPAGRRGHLLSPLEDFRPSAAPTPAAHDGGEEVDHMTVEDLLSARRSRVLDEACAALRRSGAAHYRRSGEELTRERLAELFDLVVQGLRDRRLDPVTRYCAAMAEARFEAGFGISEVQTAFNVLEEEMWRQVVDGVSPADLPEALGLLSTVLGVAKDELARSYVSLASRRHVPSLDCSALFAGTDR
jgi:uncharacterized membrane protein YbhN (UPF0104 family)